MNASNTGRPGADQPGTGRAQDVRRPDSEVPPGEPGGIAGFVDLLRLDEVGTDRFQGWCHAGAHRRVFGGHVVAQALAAAGRAAGAGRVAHSLHSNFVRPCDPRLPLVYEVERLRDGHSYTTRRVTAIQREEVVFTLSASFKQPGGGPVRQGEMPRVPGPGVLPDPYAANTRSGDADSDDYWRSTVRLTFDGRYVPHDWEGLPERTAGVEEQFVWMKSATELPADDPLLHACALVYLSDLTLSSTTAQHLRASGAQDGEPPLVSIASLDHAMWFHQPFRVDEYLLFAQRSPVAADGRGFAQGEFWTEDGVLVASVVQEALIWERRRLRKS
ncbi:acyl-CoA thioesterase domain-containing protein [Streptomyces sp. RKAG293]|uniref:acyl-CoA thioesterase n=1 Tax=Streptomyces sp. RKAG293 TaxID=2893403 RepID=UPI0020332A7E|nr:acyl-CoA thioesterase domain-containing protein [Streptomyces sp. RKAG293]MCM2416595.1 thioesterase family protein [Streptomyces sp. RKAG293]